MLLVVLPWSSFWERNYFVSILPALQPVMINDFVRGAVSGLGIPLHPGAERFYREKDLLKAARP